jgi:hypothetical protein
MPRKLENGKYEFKGGCIGEKGKDGKYKLVAVRKKKVKKSEIDNNINKTETKEIGKKEIQQKKRRSEKKKFSKKTSNQTGGNNSNLDITVHMLREFYSKNL